MTPRVARPAPPFDLAVLGGGPAGAACALTAARRGLDVLLVEAAPGADKPCGEGIMPSGVAVLEMLGLESLVRSGRPFAGVRYRLPGRAPLDVDLPACGLALWRTDLRDALDQAIAAEADIVRRCGAARVERASSGFRIQHAGGEDGARLLAVADGATGSLAPWLRGPRRATRAPARIGVRARFHEARELGRVEVHLGGGTEVYVTPLPRRAINVAVLLDGPVQGPAGAAQLLEAALERLPAARECLGEQITAPAVRALAPPRPHRVADGDSFLVGDAAGAVDPILGCGVAIALRTGWLAGRHAAALRDGAPPASAARHYARAVRRETRARARLAGALLSCARHPRLAGAALGLARRSPALARPLAAVAAGRRRQ